MDRHSPLKFWLVICALAAADDDGWTPNSTDIWPSTTLPTLVPIVRPHEHSGPRWGPYFEDGDAPTNITASVGTTVLMDCRIGLLHGKTVTWVHRKPQHIQLLTVGRHQYSADQRFDLSFRYPSNWRLRIEHVARRDRGLYECQVATHPPMAKRFFLHVTAPKLAILDDRGHAVSERYYKAGSSVQLSCVASVLEPGDHITWTKDHEPVTLPIRLNTSLGPEKIIATLIIAHAQKEESGTYQCQAADQSAQVGVHILNGELPAAVQHSACPRLLPLRSVLLVAALCTVRR